MGLEKRHITVFDFDGTLTTKDTLFDFIRFTRGSKALYGGILCCFPVLLAAMLHLCSNGKAKEYFFSHFFKGVPYDVFRSWGVSYRTRIDEIIRQEMVNTMAACQASGHDVYVITASIEEWVSPWCNEHHVTGVLATRIEVVDGHLTGRISSPNCYGQEKVNRLLACTPPREEYFLTAYGDSRGDQEMLAFADAAFRV